MKKKTAALSRYCAGVRYGKDRSSTGWFAGKNTVLMGKVKHQGPKRITLLEGFGLFTPLKRRIHIHGYLKYFLKSFYFLKNVFMFDYSQFRETFNFLRNETNDLRTNGNPIRR